jgi:hypothetical protein
MVMRDVIKISNYLYENIQRYEKTD